MTQEELAEKLYVSRQTISKWEQETSVPSLATLKELAIIFNVNLMDLIGEKETNEIIIDKYKRRNEILYLFNLFIVMMTILIALVLFRGMDDVIPAHYDFFGNITRYGNKIEYLIFPGITFIFLAFSIYFYYILSKKEEYKKAVLFYQVWMLALQITILFFTVWFGFSFKEEIKNDIFPIITGITLSLIFGIMFFSHPRFNVKKNIIFGFRTKLTLNNDVAWKKVNAVGSFSGSIATLIAYIITLITFENWNVYLIFSVIISIIPPLSYDYILRRKVRP